MIRILRLVIVSLFVGWILQSSFGCIPPFGGEPWWAFVHEYDAIEFENVSSVDRKTVQLDHPDSASVSIIGYLTGNRMSDSTFSCRVDLSISLDNRARGKCEAILDPRNFHLYVGKTPLDILEGKRISAAEGKMTANRHVRFQSTVPVLPPDGIRRKASITIDFADAVTMRGRVLKFDSLTAVTANPIFF